MIKLHLASAELFLCRSLALSETARVLRNAVVMLELSIASPTSRGADNGLTLARITGSREITIWGKYSEEHRVHRYMLKSQRLLLQVK